MSDLLKGKVDLAGDLSGVLPEINHEIGIAAAFAVDLAVREVPEVRPDWRDRIVRFGRTVEVDWPKDLFGIAYNPDGTEVEYEEETQELIDHTRKMFRDTSRFRIVTSRSRILRKKYGIEYSGIETVNPHYKYLGDRVAPYLPSEKGVLEAHEAGFAEGARALGLADMTAAQGAEIFRRLPKSINVIKIDEINEGGQVRVVTQFGNVLTLNNGENGWQNLTTSPQDLWDRTRSQAPSLPDPDDMLKLKMEAMGNIEEQLRGQIGDGRYLHPQQ